MKNTFIVIVLMAFFNLNAQSILGKWKTIDDETGEEKSIVQVYQDNGKIFGKIIEILNPKKRNSTCTKCEDENKNKPILGMQIITGLSKSGAVYDGGTILNPSNGKVYKCRLKLESENSLQVRGYVAFFYKTQYWERVQ